MDRRLLLALVVVFGCRGGGEKKDKTDSAATLLANVADPVALAVDQTGVYVAAGDGLVRIPLKGGDPVILARGDTTGVAVDSSYVYYVQRDLQRKEMAVHRLAKDGGNDTVVASDWPLLDLVSDGANLYWTGGFRLRRLEKDGSVTDLAETGLGSGLAFDDGHVYYSAGDQGNDVFRVAKSGAPAEQLVSNRSKAARLAVGGGAIYWIENNVSVVPAPIGGAPGPSVANSTFISDLAWDGGDLFIIDSVEGTIRRLPSAGEPVVIARAEDPWRLAVYDRHVYFIETPRQEGGQAAVRRVAR